MSILFAEELRQKQKQFKCDRITTENDLKYTIKHADEDIANNKKANQLPTG